MAADSSDDFFRAPDPFGEYEAVYRALRVYAFDPLRGRRGGNHLILRVPFEQLEPGPVGSRVVVVDEDLDGNRLHPPVDLNDPDIVRNGGIEPSDANPHFHQQMVYAVISHLLRTFDRALGRQMRFRAASTGAVSRLRVLPHGIKDPNAYYDPERVALAFGQFDAPESSTGRSIPGRPVYTCLSHGIVVHETTHALLDVLRPSYMLGTSAHIWAFLEGFCDIVAFLQQWTFQEALLDTIQRTGGRLYSVSLQPELEGAAGAAEDRNPLIVLGQQFGQALGMGDALRSAVGAPPDKEAFEAGIPQGRVMVTAVFEAFFRVYARRSRGLFRLSARVPSGDGDLHPDLVRRLAAEASQLATTFLQLCIRAIAYCPAVDIALGDYLRALMTVHTRLDPDDRDGLRDALIDAFARRSIYPPDVDSMSESELIWKRPGGSLNIKREVVRALQAADAQGRHDREAERELRAFCEANREALGFIPKVPLEISPFHQAIRFVGPELDVAEELVCQVIQTVEPKAGRGAPSRRLYGGTTLIFSDDGRDGRLRYAITKRIDSRRQRDQIAWLKKESVR